MKYLKALTTIASKVFQYIQSVVNFLFHFSLNCNISEQIFNISLISNTFLLCFVSTGAPWKDLAVRDCSGVRPQLRE